MEDWSRRNGYIETTDENYIKEHKIMTLFGYELKIDVDFRANKQETFEISDKVIFFD